MQEDPLDHLLTTLEVTLNAFAVCEIGAGWRLNVDPLDTAVCHFVIRGSGFLEFGERKIPIAQGTILIVPPGTAKSISGPGEAIREISAFQSCDSYSDGLLAFRAHSEGASLVLGCASVAATCGGSFGLFQCLKEPMVAKVGDNDAFIAGFDALLGELMEPKIGGKVVAECLMKHALILLLREQLNGSGSSPLLDNLGDRRIVRAAAAMIRAPNEPHRIGALADLSGMSRSSFMAHFTREYGKTPGEFLQSVRMHSAGRLLLTSGMPIKKVAASVGYASRSQFSRTFKLTFGLDPSAYRSKGASGGTSTAKVEPTIMDNRIPATAVI